MAIIGFMLVHSFRFFRFVNVFEDTNSFTAKYNYQLRLVFHVGPGKMGSSTIQSALVQSITTLTNDGWSYYHHVHLGALNQCMIARNSDSNHTVSCTNKIEQFRQFVNKARQNRRHIVLSTERWSTFSEEMNFYQEVFNDTEYEVTIVVAYRRYYHWLPSRYYQINRFRCRPNPAYEKNPSNNRYNSDLERNISPWNDFLRSTPFQHPTLVKLAGLSKYFDNNTINVINIETGDLVQDFFCDIMRAHKTCHKLQSGRPLSANQGKTLVFDRLAQYLIKNNMVDPTKVQRMAKDLRMRVSTHSDEAVLQCAPLAMILEKHDERNGKRLSRGDGPLLCPTSNVTDSLFQFSAEAERAVFPNQEDTRSDIWIDFSAQINTTLLCDVNIPSVLEDEVWQRLLERLRRDPK
jgi:hypothetical protein